MVRIPTEIIYSNDAHDGVELKSHFSLKGNFVILFSEHIKRKITSPAHVKSTLVTKISLYAPSNKALN
jgi:hypothetical protein